MFCLLCDSSPIISFCEPFTCFCYAKIPRSNIIVTGFQWLTIILTSEDYSNWSKVVYLNALVKPTHSWGFETETAAGGSVVGTIYYQTRELYDYDMIMIMITGYRQHACMLIYITQGLLRITKLYKYR